MSDFSCIAAGHATQVSACKGDWKVVYAESSLVW